MGHGMGGRRARVDGQGRMRPEERVMARGGDRGNIHVGTALRTAAAVLLLLVAYYQAPLDRPLTFASGILFVGALLLAALAVVVEVRAILASTTPMLRAIRVIALGLPLLLVLFAATYITVDGQQTDAFSEPLSRTDGLYFTVTTFATVGYGDITPRTELARSLVTIQMLVGLIAVGVIAKVLLGAVRRAQERITTVDRADDR
jgi:voltage-gated potassium channel